MKLIPLDAVMEILEESKFNQSDSEGRLTLNISPTCIQRIKEIPTIDPVEIIEEEIKNCTENMEGNKLENNEYGYSYWGIRKSATEHILLKFKSLS